MKNSQILNKDEERMKILHVVMAAYHYDMASMYACFAKRSTTIAGAQEVAKIIKSFNAEKLTEFNRIKFTAECADNAIKYFDTYRGAAQIYPFDERGLESFCKYYAHAGNKFKVWKLNTDFITGIGLACLGYYLGKTTKNEKDNRIETVTSQICFFSYLPSLVLRSFAEISIKYKEIESKVTSRNLKKNVLQ